MERIKKDGDEMTECQIDKPPFFQCCCNCKMQVQIVDRMDNYHYIGWGCMLFTAEGMRDPQFEKIVYLHRKVNRHSCGCECYGEIAETRIREEKEVTHDPTK